MSKSKVYRRHTTLQQDIGVLFLVMAIDLILIDAMKPYCLMVLSFFLTSDWWTRGCVFSHVVSSYQFYFLLEWVWKDDIYWMAGTLKQHVMNRSSKWMESWVILHSIIGWQPLLYSCQCWWWSSWSDIWGRSKPLGESGSWKLEIRHYPAHGLMFHTGMRWTVCRIVQNRQLSTFWARFSNPKEVVSTFSAI